VPETRRKRVSFSPDPHQPSSVTLVVIFPVFWSFVPLFVYYWPFIICSLSRPSFSVLEFPSAPPVVEQEQEQSARRGQGQELARACNGARELLPWTAGPGAQRNFDPEHPPRDGGTPRAAALRSFYISCLLQFVLCVLALRITHPHADPSADTFARALAV
jgi:hypothetical protein